MSPRYILIQLIYYTISLYQLTFLARMLFSLRARNKELNSMLINEKDKKKIHSCVLTGKIITKKKTYIVNKSRNFFSHGFILTSKVSNKIKNHFMNKSII